MATMTEQCLLASAPDLGAYRICANACADQKSFVKGVQMKKFFLVDEIIEGPNITINVPSSARQQNAI